jgi:signal transduction histidine kinase
LSAKIASNAEQQLLRGRVAGDILSGLLELSATKQRLRAWSLRALIGADHSPTDGEMLRSRMADQIGRLGELSRLSRADAIRAGDTVTTDNARDEALALISTSVASLRPAIEAIRLRQNEDTPRAAWAQIESIFDMGAGRDLREVLNNSIAEESLQLQRTRAETDRALDRLRTTSRVMSIAISLSGLVAALVTVRAFRRPLQEMSTAADAYADGRLDYRLGLTGMDEFGRLGSSINHMAEELQDRRREEANQRQHLELVIGKRTAALEDALAKLKASEARRRMLLGDISHELRSPTTVIRGEAEIALRGEKSAEDYRASLSRISQAATQMGALIDDLLMMARSDAEALTLIKEPIDISGPIEEALLSARTQAIKRNVKLSVELPDREVLIAADAMRLRQLVALLLDNAVRYSPPGACVSLTCSCTDKSVHIVIQDEGIGIPQDDLPFIFERDFRAHNARVFRPDGTGLGLAIARALTAGHAGRLELKSVEGSGTTASLELPLQEEDLTEAPGKRHEYTRD